MKAPQNSRTELFGGRNGNYGLRNINKEVQVKYILGGTAGHVNLPVLSSGRNKTDQIGKME